MGAWELRRHSSTSGGLQRAALWPASSSDLQESLPLCRGPWRPPPPPVWQLQERKGRKKKKRNQTEKWLDVLTQGRLMFQCSTHVGDCRSWGGVPLPIPPRWRTHPQSLFSEGGAGTTAPTAQGRVIDREGGVNHFLYAPSHSRGSAKLAGPGRWKTGSRGFLG